ncbi:hypothetical protein AVEN_227201-1 [Araneus ventricosus]|uniref:Uncharacterized protein n=1 Tax=Araneus ventricosus TaxID=182803 RepID=A0A4Y2LZA2_ARAVE|nr:hypothetical protein AVEN_227201-1 [Araneus ventricosus]
MTLGHCSLTEAALEQDEAPPHWKLKVREVLNNVIPNHWIGRAGTNDKVTFPLLPDHWTLPQVNFFLLGFVKNKVYVPPLPRNLEDLRTCIGNALKLVTPDMLKRVWEEMDYCLDIVCLTRGSHIEHLQCHKIKYLSCPFL